jgi:peptidoglycan/xylan/chitin deacetylase (PgdA/CDA1 family)
MSRFKTLTKAGLCGLYKYSGAGPVQEALLRCCGRPFMVVLLFHRVTDSIPEDGLTISTAHFRRVCQMLRRHFRVVPLGEVFRGACGASMPPRSVAMTFDDCYRDNLFAARFLAEHRLPATFFLPTSYVGTDKVFEWDRGLPRQPNLTWADVSEMADMGFEIGSHTVSHANLALVSTEQARAEIADSRKALQDRLGRPVRWFAYPFGGPLHLRPDVRPLIEEAGYEGALSAFGGFVRPGSDNWALPREAVPCFRSVLNLELHLTGCLNWFYALKRALGRPEPERGSSPYIPRVCLPPAEPCVSAVARVASGD